MCRLAGIPLYRVGCWTETVWGVVLRNHLGFKVVRPDAQDLLEWARDDKQIALYNASSPRCEQVHNNGSLNPRVRLAI